MFSLPSFSSMRMITVKNGNYLNGGFLTSIRQASSILGYLKPNEGATKNYKRLGRGASSDKGKTSGRGQKGQKARGKVPWWLEGGQTPYYKRFPMTGFKNPNKKNLYEIKLNRIQDFWDNGRIPLEKGETLTMNIMVSCGLVTGNLKDGVKILSNGMESYNVPLNIEATKASKKSIETIENLGNEFSAKYFTKLGLRSHLNPEKFLLKFGYIPLEARPTSKKNIEYYSNYENRGYLQKDKSILLEPLQKAREEGKNKKSTKVFSKYKSLEEQLQDAQLKESSSVLN